MEKNKTVLTIERAKSQTSPIWAKKGERHGIKYDCKLSNDRGEMVFEFWDSIHDAEIINATETFCPIESLKVQKDFNAEAILKREGIRFHSLYQKDNREKEVAKYSPNAYDVLACLSPLYEDNFSDFCASFGYDEDSITASKTWDACREQDRQLRRIFTLEQLDELTAIN